MEETLLEKLAAPMEYKTKPGQGGKPQNYIDSRQVQDRLDEVFGACWQCKYEEIKGNPRQRNKAVLIIMVVKNAIEQKNMRLQTNESIENKQCK